jgi:hypothetical protein
LFKKEKESGGFSLCNTYTIMNSVSTMNDPKKDTDVLLVDKYLYRILSAAQLLSQKPLTDQEEENAVMQDDDAANHSSTAWVLLLLLPAVLWMPLLDSY